MVNFSPPIVLPHLILQECYAQPAIPLITIREDIQEQILNDKICDILFGNWIGSPQKEIEPRKAIVAFHLLNQKALNCFQCIPRVQDIMEQKLRILRYFKHLPQNFLNNTLIHSAEIAPLLIEAGAVPTPVSLIQAIISKSLIAVKAHLVEGVALTEFHLKVAVCEFLNSSLIDRQLKYGLSVLPNTKLTAQKLDDLIEIIKICIDSGMPLNDYLYNELIDNKAEVLINLLINKGVQPTLNNYKYACRYYPNFLSHPGLTPTTTQASFNQIIMAIDNHVSFEEFIGIVSKYHYISPKALCYAILYKPEWVYYLFEQQIDFLNEECAWASCLHHVPIKIRQHLCALNPELIPINIFHHDT